MLGIGRNEAKRLHGNRLEFIAFGALRFVYHTFPFAFP
jgi:hypothetical protein